MRINPSNHTTYVNLGVAYLNIGDPEEAIKKFKKAIEIDDQNTEPYYGLAKAFLDLQRNADAIRNFRKTLKINPRHVRSLNAIAYPLIKTYKFVEGWKHYEYRWLNEPAKSIKRPYIPLNNDNADLMIQRLLGNEKCANNNYSPVNS